MGSRHCNETRRKASIGRALSFGPLAAGLVFCLGINGGRGEAKLLMVERMSSVLGFERLVTYKIERVGDRTSQRKCNHRELQRPVEQSKPSW